MTPMDQFVLVVWLAALFAFVMATINVLTIIRIKRRSAASSLSKKEEK